MADVFTKAKRSEVMSRIRGRGNRETKLALGKLLRAARITGWRRQVRLKVEGSNTSPRPSPQKNVRSRQPSPGLRPPSDSLAPARSARKGPSPAVNSFRRFPSSSSPVPTGVGQRGEGVRVRPDFVFRKERVVIFVDGCFWHGCPKHSSMPANNREFWLRKLTGNKEHDRLVTRALRQSGWRVLRIWEHDLRHPTRVVTRIQNALNGSSLHKAQS
jgi:DNA mismatch endonuclease (patch repair protein)